ncbi:hypothetical protein C8R44DRAFT_976454 [Mycena epipterygia]|nr:hypothetical protein C8R44DRAFT_976454 [Mycena epipterygia]
MVSTRTRRRMRARRRSRARLVLGPARELHAEGSQMGSALRSWAALSNNEVLAPSLPPLGSLRVVAVESLVREASCVAWPIVHASDKSLVLPAKWANDELRMA